MEYLQSLVLDPKSLKAYGFPYMGEKLTNRAFVFKSDHFESKRPSPDVNGCQSVVSALSTKKHTCARCSKMYSVNELTGVHIWPEKCHHHWGKLKVIKNTLQYLCCAGDRSSPGCTIADTHVWSGIDVGVNMLHGAAETHRKKGERPSAFALDCEMCFTKAGPELTKVVLVDLDGNLVYQSYVKPLNTIIDHCTRFSGITADDLKDIKTTIFDVQREILNLISAETILIGHGLENDLRALKLVHTNVIDISLLFSRQHGRRVSLKDCAK